MASKRKRIEGGSKEETTETAAAATATATASEHQLTEAKKAQKKGIQQRTDNKLQQLNESLNDGKDDKGPKRVRCRIQLTAAVAKVWKKKTKACRDKNGNVKLSFTSAMKTLGLTPSGVRNMWSLALSILKPVKFVALMKQHELHKNWNSNDQPTISKRLNFLQALQKICGDERGSNEPNAMNVSSKKRSKRTGDDDKEEEIKFNDTETYFICDFAFSLLSAGVNKDGVPATKNVFFESAVFQHLMTMVDGLSTSKFAKIEKEFKWWLDLHKAHLTSEANEVGL